MYTVIAAFDDRQAAQRSVDTLVARGIPRDSIDLQSRSDTLDPVAPVTSPRPAGDPSDVRRDDDDGFLAGARHFFASLFGTDEDTQVGMYSEAIRRGSSVVTVDASDQGEADRAAQVLREQGGTIDLDERSEAWRAEGWGGGAAHHSATGGTAGAMAAQALVDNERIAPTAERNRERAAVESGLRTDDPRRTATREGDDVVMPVVQEDVKIGKRTVGQGGVRVVRRVTETPVSELVRLRDERARVERRPVDREATRAEMDNLHDGSVEVRETTQEPVVEKVARVVEEVVVGREVDEHTERVEDTARRTDVDIERLAREADDTLNRATGDAHAEDDDLGLPPGNRPPNQAPGRKPGDAPKDKGAGSRGRGARR